MKDIQHQIGLIPGLVFLNKLASIMNTKEHEKIKTQVDDLLDKRLVQKSESSYVVPTVLVHKKMDLGECVLIAKLSTTFLFMRK